MKAGCQASINPQDAKYVRKVMNLNRMPGRSELRFTERFNEPYLQSLRKEGDPLADATVVALYNLAKEQGSDLPAMHDLFGTVQENAAKDPSSVFAEYMNECNSVPSWVDLEQIERAQAFLMRTSPFMGLSLFAGSLVGGSMFPRMSYVTNLTGNFSPGSSSRRVEETSALIAQIALPGAMKERGKGHETLARVRLLHSALRYLLPLKGLYTKTHEVPVNQQDLAITLGLFGYLNLRSLKRMGVHVTRHEVADFTALWRYAGYLLGIKDELLPRSQLDQQEFFMASLIHQCMPEKIHPKTKCVLDDMAKTISVSVNGSIPEATLKRYLHQMTRYLSGNEYCTGMQFEDEGDNYWGILATKMMAKSFSVSCKWVPFGSDVTYWVHLQLLRKRLSSQTAKEAGKSIRLSKPLVGPKANTHARL